MKSRFLTCFAAITLFAALVIPVQLAAQNNQDHHRHHVRTDTGLSPVHSLAAEPRADCRRRGLRRSSAHDSEGAAVFGQSTQ
jgi:hypothetical protein